MQRPTAPVEQPDYERGQKTWHTLKTLVVIQATGHLGCWSHPGDGHAADTSWAALAGSTLPPGSCLDQDQDFQGFVLPGSTIVQPKKTPPGGELTPPEHAPNRRLAAIRMRIAQALGGVKRDRIVPDTLRLLKDGRRDAVMDPGGGWHTFRLQYRPWH
jgi:hypothetical protein